MARYSYLGICHLPRWLPVSSVPTRETRAVVGVGGSVSDRVAGRDMVTKHHRRGRHRLSRNNPMQKIMAKQYCSGEWMLVWK